MKKLFTLVAMAFMAIGANAQAIAYEIDWTNTDQTPFWYGSPAEVSVEPGVGLVIESGGDGTDVYWNPQVPMIQHMGTADAPIAEGGQYLVKFAFTTPAAGELRLDFVQPCEMLAKGPPWTNAGTPSRDCTRLGHIASLRHVARAPVAPSLPAVTRLPSRS